ncbi:hypothetical protein NQ317_018757 [Molorchus minor]|uniref:Carboxylesterase type B domain-containing protein n=1 Tax=Molorchus minor TaxID=1323400 RepID=A0ABQ9J0N7_9CUCU|nr:hypothetical protein NQ317_018757 [Molorchus minor]
MIKVLLLFFIVSSIQAQDSDPLLVTLPNGQIRGHELVSLHGNTYYGFQEIPYASPPVGNLRFKEPVPPQNWEGVLDATQNTKICLQTSSHQLTHTKEDCLYLNVYTPVVGIDITNLIMEYKNFNTPMNSKRTRKIPIADPLADEIIVSIPNGQILGRERLSEDNQVFYAFQEIPYASPPVGELRFKNPVPAPSWDGLLDARVNTKKCYQQELQVATNITETEDCLYLNVYTPLKPASNYTELLPVLFWIHGGAYKNGDGSFSSYSPVYFIDYDIVVVTINYRLGPFGFLTTEDDVIPSNLGLKDQNLALIWANENIHFFGGDPEQITIIGESAGASSVGHHLISKKSSGLFRAAILESGTGIASWSHQLFAKYYAYQLGSAINSNFTSDNTSEELLQLLQQASPAEIINTTVAVIPELGIGLGNSLIWTPVIDNDDVNDKFVDGPMEDNMEKGNFNQVPTLIGFNSEEILLFYNGLENVTAAFLSLAAYFDEDLSRLININFNMTSLDKVEAGTELRNAYTDGNFQDDLGAVIRFNSDQAFTTPGIRHAALQSNFTDVYMYQFSYKGVLGEAFVSGDVLNFEGYNMILKQNSFFSRGHLTFIFRNRKVGHAEELLYLWDFGFDMSQFPPSDTLTHKRLLLLWSNFIKYFVDEMIKVLLLFLIVSSIQAQDSDPLLVTLPDGQIRGHELVSLHGNTYYGFQEIPYASPPVGNLRFKEPVPPQNWEGVLNATQNTKICLQTSSHQPSGTTPTEDCLYLNVYTPVKPGSDDGLAVLLWIHGGGFGWGDGTYQYYGPRYYMDYGIIVVTINYRLGALGFLTTVDGVIPANNGVRDMAAAINWTHTNIHLFGGDPEKITICGESSGSNAVGYLVLSPQTKGLFRAAIQESGSPLTGAGHQPHAKYYAYQVGMALDESFTENSSSEELLELLQNAAADDIMSVQLTVPSGMETALGEHAGKENYTQSLVDQAQYYDEDLSRLIQNKFNMSDENKVRAGSALRAIYTEGQFQDDVYQIIKFNSDEPGTTPSIRQAVLQSTFSDVYIYQFSYRGEMGASQSIPFDPPDNVGHFEELYYLWDFYEFDINTMPEADILTHRRLLTLWTNFVKYLNPTPEEDELLENVIWTKVSPDNITYLNINVTLETGRDPKRYRQMAAIYD